MQGNRFPTVIAEIGCNHKGEMKIAREMIKIAAQFCKADFVKFQKRNPKELLTEVEYNAPHPNEYHSYGDSYGEHREFLEFSIDQHKQLKDWCEEWKIGYSASVWDITSATEMISLEPEHVKVPSATNLNFKLLGLLCDSYGGDIHISFGMTSRKEEEDIVGFLKKRGRNKDLVIYSCTSGYPVAFEDICLLEISRIRETFGNDVKAIGFSGHHLGIAADVGAITLGAEVVERHFTLDRTWKGTDHSASLEPDGMRRLARDVRNVKKALTCKSEEILPVEKVQREKLKRSREEN